MLLRPLFYRWTCLCILANILLTPGVPSISISKRTKHITLVIASPTTNTPACWSLGAGTGITGAKFML